MDYFVEMTTHVPQGTPQETVDDIRAREAARAANSQPTDASSGCGAHRWRPGNGAPSVCSALTTTVNWPRS